MAFGSSLNDYTDTGFWYDAINASDEPSSLAGHRTFLVVLTGITSNSKRVCQFIFDIDVTKIFMRAYSEGGSWSQWGVFTGSPV